MAVLQHYLGFMLVLLTMAQQSNGQAVIPGTLRLVSRTGQTSTILSEGRLEVYLYGQWGTVCNKDFGHNEAIVACRQLGFLGARSYDAALNHRLSSNNLSQAILLHSLNCGHRSSSLLSCTEHQSEDILCTSHHDDVALSCYKEGTARLRENTNTEFPTSGRIDIYYNGDWDNNICFDDYFTANEANLLCQQLGFARAYLIGSANQFSSVQDSGSKTLYSVDCSSITHLLSLLPCFMRSYSCQCAVALTCTEINGTPYRQSACIPEISTTIRQRNNDNDNNNNGGSNISLGWIGGAGVIPPAVIFISVLAVFLKYKYF